MKILLFLLVLVVCLYGMRRYLSAPGLGTQRPQGPVDQMGVQEAQDVLGLGANPSREDVIHAHRRLMQHVHPDKGGSAVLARQLNEAKRVLLKNLHTSN